MLSLSHSGKLIFSIKFFCRARSSLVGGGRDGGNVALKTRKTGLPTSRRLRRYDDPLRAGRPTPVGLMTIRRAGPRLALTIQITLPSEIIAPLPCNLSKLQHYDTEIRARCGRRHHIVGRGEGEKSTAPGRITSARLGHGTDRDT